MTSIGLAAAFTMLHIASLQWGKAGETYRLVLCALIGIAWAIVVSVVTGWIAQ